MRARLSDGTGRIHAAFNNPRPLYPSEFDKTTGHYLRERSAKLSAQEVKHILKEAEPVAPWTVHQSLSDLIEAAEAVSGEIAFEDTEAGVLKEAMERFLKLEV